MGCARGIKRMRRAVRVLTLLLVASCGGISTRSGDEATGAQPVAAGGSPNAGADSPASEAGAGRGTPAGSFGSGGVVAIGGRAATGGAPVVSGGAAGAPPIECGSYRPLPAPSASCRGIKTGASCAAEGQLCPCLLCGLADLGARTCHCDAGVWSCSACQYPEDWRWPSDVPFCTDQADKLPCASEGLLCQGAPGGEVCLCYRDPEDFLIWDCDKPPAMSPW